MHVLQVYTSTNDFIIDQKLLKKSVLQWYYSSIDLNLATFSLDLQTLIELSFETVTAMSSSRGLGSIK